MIARTRLLPALLGLLLAGSLGAAPDASARPQRASDDPTHGEAGIGDPYFPLDGNGGIDVLHYDVRVGYDLGSRRLTGRTGLDVRATQALTRFDLDLLLDVRSVRVDGQPARFRRDGRGHELVVSPATPIAAGQTFRVDVKYAGRPGEERYLGESNWLAGDREVVTMNEPHMAPWWFAANDHPSDKATYDIHVTVPRRVPVVSNGVLVGKDRHRGRTSWHWRSSSPMASYLAFFAAGSFDVETSDCLGVPSVTAVSKRIPPGSGAISAQRLDRMSCRILTALSGQLGAYPFEATGGLVTGLPVGFALENQTRPTYPVLTRFSTGLVAHELAHQWFGDSVSVARWRDIWLNEGFAQFMQTWYTTEVAGDSSTAAWLAETYRAVRDEKGFWNVRIEDPGPDFLFSEAIYGRGAMAVAALRQRLGDEVFWPLLRTWLTQRRDDSGSVADFRALATQLSGQDLTGFFDAWLSRRAVPARTAANGF